MLGLSLVDSYQVTKTVMVVMYELLYVVEKCLRSGNVSDVLVDCSLYTIMFRKRCSIMNQQLAVKYDVNVYITALSDSGSSKRGNCSFAKKRKETKRKNSLFKMFGQINKLTVLQLVKIAST